MQDRTQVIQRKQMLKLMQQMNLLQIDIDEDELCNDFEIILDLNDDDEQNDTKQDNKESKQETNESIQQKELSENETIPNTIIKKQKKPKKLSNRVLFDSYNNTYGCTVCQTKFKSLYNLLNHQFKFHNRKIKY